ncbi:DNA replication and repair protein RecF [Caldicellulosiruptor saccharolyticus DSM 8903]|uniref:DNA replication and repair protein RecF n=1 Tax=Caldicellulosiruptor saccharolyticus (strain ATCC 43494 / DSM 8903 / Tp8T 6331) TaxID=351627 RepID=A4XFI3_CALS8|nr:DNA replication/repair protein RecF [Caldicellulosiruptor saccharolyticus]ABP65668.1 DNA replication and repair protein RecF [Caldicellulosiruptor saccharolyticus DSM 8903]
MIIKSIYLENFRNHNERFFEFKDGINLILGKNASGKTNLLEAIYFCLCGKSFKSKDTNLISFDSEYFKLEASVLANDVEYGILCYVDRLGQKRIMINEKKINRLSELIEKFKFVYFEPDSTELIKQDPKVRRKFLDMEVAKLYPYMIKTFQDYQKALMSRNAFLKSYDKKDIIDVYDIELSKLGCQILKKREETIKRLSEATKEIWYKVFEDKSTIDIVFRPSIPSSSEEEYYSQLKKQFEKDVQMGFTTKGVHRDDFDVFINGQNAKEYASEGQIKFACIAISLASAKLFEKPVLLLDDIFSELDSEKRKNVLKLCKDYQAIITSADEKDSLVKTGLLSHDINNLIQL